MCTMVGGLARVVLAAGVLGLVSGCVEITQIITLNPDGRGKMKIEVVTAAFNDLAFTGGFGGDAGGKKVKTLDEIKKDGIGGFISSKAGLKAWKDLAVEWTKDGRLRMTGTCYFDRLDDLDASPAKGGKDPLDVKPANSFGNSFKFKRDKDGTLHITGASKSKSKDGLMPFKDGDDEPDLAKMNDQELDTYLLKQRVEYQKVKPLLNMMFADLKLKTVLHLPGEVVKHKGFKKDDAGTVSQVIDGNEFMTVLKKFVTQDNASWKKLIKSNNPKGMMALLGPMAMYEDPNVTVQKLTGPLFDFDAEVRAAQAAYPALRKALGIGEDVQLPGEK
jgi:hypothetical protein